MGADRDPAWRASPEAQPKIREICERVLPGVRAAAEKCGYAIGVHGSLIHDLDMIACPWTNDAVDPHDLVDAVRGAIEAEIGTCYRPRREDGFGVKPHGRMAFTLLTSSGVRGPWGCLPFFDLSVMPRLEAKP